MNACHKVVLASGNPGKLRELQQILADCRIELIPQSEFDVVECEETGLSFVENAILKARNAARATALPAIADDSGIAVDALGGAPGIYSARYAGDDASDSDNLQKLLDDVKASSSSDRRCRFVCVMVYVRSAADPLPLICEGIWEGRLVDEPRGNNGFGYDPIFWVAAHGCTSAELPTAVKNRISHRAQAAAKLLERLSQVYRDA